MTAVLTTPETAAATSAPAEAVMSPFAEGLCEIEYLLDTDPDRARERWAEVLALASAEERAFLDRAAEMLTRAPFATAARQLGWMAKSRPEWRQMVIEMTADSDPGLHRPLLPTGPEVSIEAAEWVRRSIRDQRGHDRLTATPRPATDAARLSPQAIRARRTRIPAPRTGLVSLRHCERDRRVAQRREALYADYAARRLYAIDTAPEDDRTPPAIEPRKQSHLLWGHVAAELWERSYFLHVVDCYTDRDRDLLDAPDNAKESAVDGSRGRDAAHEARAASFLTAHDASDATDAIDSVSGSGGSRRRGRRPQTRRPWVRTADRVRFAVRRTGIAVPDDHDILLPYSELDVTEDTWQGSGLDYDRAALLGYLGWPCVGCWIDRPGIDRAPVHTRDGARVSDDGLCDVCRADGHPGIPALLGRWTLGDFVESRCDHIAATHPRQVRAILDRIRAAAAGNGLTWRLITRWMAMNLDQPARPRPSRAGGAPAARRRPHRAGKLGAGQRIGRCDACARNRVVNHDGYCTPCRIDLRLVPARGSAPAAPQAPATAVAVGHRHGGAARFERLSIPELVEILDSGRPLEVSMRADGGHTDLIDWAVRNERFVRIDRGTDWGNPFVVGRDGDRAAVLDAYAAHLAARPDLLARLRAGELAGKVLGCWCSPQPCHADILTVLTLYPGHSPAEALHGLDEAMPAA